MDLERESLDVVFARAAAAAAAELDATRCGPCSRRRRRRPSCTPCSTSRFPWTVSRSTTCVTNYRTTTADIDRTVDVLRTLGADLAPLP